jgi:outer membrane protein TolC
MAYLPKLTFNYLYGHNVFSGNASIWEGQQNLDYPTNIQQYFGLNLSVPILTGGSRMARVQQAKINLEQIDIYKKQLRDNLKLQYETAKAEYSYALNSYYTQLRNVEISKKIRDTNSKKFSEGIIGSLEFTQAENQYQDALRSVIDASNNVLDKKVKLEKIIGKYNN